MHEYLELGGERNVSRLNNTFQLAPNLLPALFALVCVDASKKCSHVHALRTEKSNVNSTLTQVVCCPSSELRFAPLPNTFFRIRQSANKQGHTSPNSSTQHGRRKFEPIYSRCRSPACPRERRSRGRRGGANEPSWLWRSADWC